MKTATAICCAVVLAAPAVIAAQGGAPQGGAGVMGKDMKPAGAITMVGCVAAGTDGKYTLTNATIPDAQDQSKKGMKPVTYDLMGTELKAHVGHKVEVTGSTAVADPTDKAKQAKPAGEARDSITVKSIKMVSATCTP